MRGPRASGRRPRVTASAFTRRLTRLSTNAPGRAHYNPWPARGGLLYRVDETHFRLYDPHADPPPIRDGAAPHRSDRA